MESVISVVSFASKNGRTGTHTLQLERMYDSIQMSGARVNVTLPLRKDSFGSFHLSALLSQHLILMHFLKVIASFLSCA